MRLGVFGGSFDPVHLGHLELARCAQQQAKLDEVWFLPAATQPLKRHGPVATDVQRIAMLELAIAEQPTWKVSQLETERGGLSYTADTLRELSKSMPKAELYFLMGADALHDLPNWYQPEEICQLATPLVVARAGEVEPDFDVLLDVCPPERVAEIRAARVEMSELPIASSVIRKQIAAGHDVRELLPEAIFRYIERHDLYRR